MRGLKRLGLAAAATLAIGAAGVLSAQAAAPEFNKEVMPTYVEGEQVVPFVFEDQAGFIAKCANARFVTTSTSEKSTGLTLEPLVAGCTFVGVAALWRMNGCGYFFSLVGGSKPPTATMNVVCPGEEVMEIESMVVECTVYIAPQKGLKHVTFANFGTGKTRGSTASIVVEEVKYEEEGENCPSPGFGEFGEFAGTVPLIAYKDEAGKYGPQVGFWVQ